MDLYPQSPDDDPVVEDFFGAGKPGYTDGDPESLEQGTVVGESFHNGVTGELMGILDKMGVEPDAEQYDQLWTALNHFAAGDFGDGSAGGFTFDTTITAGNDAEVDNLTIQNGGEFNTNGYKLFVRGTLTIEAGGVIQNNGSNGASGADGGAGGAGAPTGSLAGGQAGGAGGTGADGSAAGLLLVALGGDGGDGGDEAGATKHGGAGGEAQDPTVTHGSYRTAQAARTGELRGFGSQNFFRGGAGGGGGAGLDLVTGGGGGGGGGVLIIWANEIINNGTIRANGGNGGLGQGVSGGGGGGGGGVIYLVYRRMSGSGTVEAGGGTGGASGGGGETGTDGSAGRVIELRF